MIFGTDLAIERREITNSGKNDGVTVKKRRVKSASVTEIEITTDAGAEKLGKPVGTYVTVELPPFSSEFDDADSRMLAVRDEIKKLLPKNTSGVLVVVSAIRILLQTLSVPRPQKIYFQRAISQNRWRRRWVFRLFGPYRPLLRECSVRPV